MKLKIVLIISSILIGLHSSAQKKLSKDELQDVASLSRQGQIDKALEKVNALKKTTAKDDPQYLLLIMMSGELNIKALNCEDAIRDAEEIMQLSPDLETDCLSQIALFKKYLGDFEGAIIAYKRILILNPTDHIIYNNIASTYNEAGNFVEAIETLNSNPSSERLHTEYYHYSFAYLNLNKLDSARHYIEKYLAADDEKNFSLAYTTGAKIYFALGYKKKSCEYITKANEIIINFRYFEQLNEKSAKVQNYYFVKKSLNEIKETEELKSKLCE